MRLTDDWPGSIPFRFLIAVIVTSASGIALFLVVRLDPAARVDEQLTESIHGATVDRPLIADLAKAVTWIGNPLFLTALVAVVVVWLAMNARFTTMLWLVSVTAVGAVVETGLKRTIQRSRPDLDNVLLQPRGTSFPSGHAMNTLTVLGAIALVLICTRAGIHRKVLVAAPAVGFLVGISRPMLGVHYVSDVLSGWALATLWLAATGPLLFSLASAAPHAPNRMADGCQPTAG